MIKRISLLTILSLACLMTLPSFAAGVSSTFYINNHSGVKLSVKGKIINPEASEARTFSIKDTALLWKNRSYNHEFPIKMADGTPICLIHESNTTYYAAFGILFGLHWGPKMTNVNVWSNNSNCQVNLFHKTRLIFGGEEARVYINVYNPDSKFV